MTSLLYVFLNYPKLAHLISTFLTYSDFYKLALTTKILNSQVLQLILEQLKTKYESFVMSTIKKLRPKNQKNEKIKLIKTPSSLILKMSVFDTPKELLCRKFWQTMKVSVKELQMLLKEDKFIKEQNNMFFRSPNDQIMFMNRTLIDDSLDLANSKEKNNEMEALEECKYEKLYTDNELTSNSYDFSSMQSMLQRQKKIISNLDLQSKKNEAFSPDIPTQLENLKRFTKICIVLCHGGNFSFGIFDQSGKCLVHRSDHKYVTRKKAGQRQMAKDKHSGSSIKSIGSQIRRENEKVHQMNVDSILDEHLKEIEECDLVLLQAPGMNKLMLVDENKPLFTVKRKIRSMCLTAKKANYTEVERLFKAITRVYFIVEES